MLRKVLTRDLRKRSLLLPSQLKRNFSVSTNLKVSLPPKELTIPKFTFPKHTTTIKEINKDIESHLGETITISGWIDQKPKKIGKNIVFATFRDFEGKFIQIITKNPEIVSSISKAQAEDCVAITGNINKKVSKDQNDSNIEWELDLTDYKLLNQSDILNSQLKSLSTSNNELFPPQYRYLQLRLPFFQESLRKRAKAAQIVRNTLTSKNFTEIETPLLFKSTPEGAREFLVPTRKSNSFYALPQSPQQYKQLLMASGIKNYFQIARCFRDEDLRADRQPEFTQVDLEMSFADAKDVQNVIENLVVKVWNEVTDQPIVTIDGETGTKIDKFVHLSYQEALTKYGIDKPDLRSTLSFIDLSEFTKVKNQNEFNVFEVCILKDAFKTNKDISSKLFDDSLYKNRKPIIIPIKTEQDKIEWLSKFESIIEINDSSKIHELIKLEIGDIIAGSTRAELPYENPTPLGAFRQLAIASYSDKWKRPNSKFVGAWIEDFPLFTPSEIENTSIEKQDFPIYDYNKLQSTHHPFTMAKPEDYEKLETAPAEVKGEHYDLVINGVELGGGSRRVHDSDLQRFIFTEILNIKDPDYLFGHLLKALSLGCPPHAGFAIGFDRMCAMLIGSSSIRDVVAFPKTSSGNDPVVGSPSQVSDEVLKEYYVKKLSE